MNHKIIIKIVITLGLVIYLLSKLDLNAIYKAFLEINFYFILLTVPFIVLMYFIKTQKWNILLDSINLRIPFYDALKIILIGTFYGALTPGRVGEISRSFYLDAKKSKTIPTVIFDRILDVFCLLLMSIISILIFFNDEYLIYLVILMIAVFIIGVISITNEKTVSCFFKILNQNGESEQNYKESMKGIMNNRKVMLYTFSLTFIYYIFHLFVYWLILKALNPMLDDRIILSLPIVVISGFIPISISGLGVRELVCVTIFEMMNEDPTYGYLFSMILYLLIFLIPGLIGSTFTLKKIIHFVPIEVK